MVQVYVLLGALGSGRREVLLDLVKSGLDAATDRAVVLLPQAEPTNRLDAKLDPLPAVQVLRWSASAGDLDLPEMSDAASHAFFILDGQRDPIDQLEALRDWLGTQEEAELARIVTVVHSRLLFEKPELQAWFDVCVHFSDIVLFNRREDVPNKWFRDFEQRYKKKFYPCIFEVVKGGRVNNPAEILYPEPRRLSQAFDSDLAGGGLGAADHQLVHDVVDEDDIGGEAYDPDDDVDASALDDGDDEQVREPYFERDEAGRRKKQIPDIRPYLAPLT